MSARGRGGSSIGSVLILLGCVAVVSAAFGGGFMAGRFWPDIRARVMKQRPAVSAPDRPAETTATRGGPGNGASSRAADGVPMLTFYQELTAPLPARAAGPAKAGPAKAEAAKAEAPKAEAPKAEASKAEPPKAEPPKAEPSKVEAAKPETPKIENVKLERASTDGARSLSATASDAKPAASPSVGSETYTVQVAAYRTRAQAEALRERLAARGVTADVGQAETRSGVLHRVRVGSYATRAEAVEAAARIAAEARVETFVATR